MIHKKGLLALGCILFFCLLALPSQSQGKQYHEAKRHFNRARDLEAFNDPQVEQEYRLAIKARRGYYPEALFRLSVYLERNLRFSEAAEALESYIKKSPRRNHTQDQEGLNDLRRAAILQARIKNIDKPALPDLLEFASLVSRYGRNHQKDAVPYAEKAVSLYPMSSEAYVLLGRLLLGSPQQARRLEILKKAVELDPNSPKAHQQLGWYYIERVRGKDAAEEFLKALEISNEKLTDSWQGLGHALVLQGRNKEAIEAFNKYLQSGEVPEHYEGVIREKIKRLQEGSLR